MPVRVIPHMLEYMRMRSGALHFVLEHASDPDIAVQAMQEARRRLAMIAHPEEGEPYAKYISDVDHGATGPWFWIDMADAEAYPGVLETALEVVVTALENSGVTDGLLSYPENEAEPLTHALRSSELHASEHAEARDAVDTGEVAQWSRAWLLIHSLESAINRGREMALPDAEILAYVEEYLDRLKRSMAAEPSATELFGSSDDDD